MKLDSDFEEQLSMCKASTLKCEITNDNPEDWEDIAWFHQFLRILSKASDSKKKELVKQLAHEHGKCNNMGKASKAVLECVKI